MLKLSSPRPCTRSSMLALISLLVVFSSTLLLAQTTVATGSIVGTVTDPSGALVDGARVLITNVATNRELSLASNASGSFNSGALEPGTYRVQISSKGFSTVSLSVTVQVGNTASANAKLADG